MGAVLRAHIQRQEQENDVGGAGLLSGCAIQHHEQGGELLAATRGENGGSDAGNVGGKVAIGDGTAEAGLGTGATSEANADG